MGTIPKVPVTKKGDLNEVPFYLLLHYLNVHLKFHV
jgi:hypothetical protein